MDYKKIAVITKRAYNARQISTVQYTNDRVDDMDSGWRLFKGDEDDHVLDRMECFRLITLEEAMTILPALEGIINKTACTYYHADENGVFTESESFEAESAPEADPFLQQFAGKK